MQVLYRAKGTDDRDKNIWYEGYYVKLADTTYCVAEDYQRAEREGKDPIHHYIIFDQMTDWGLPNKHLQATVRPETLSMFSGKKDSTGKRIFQNDIIKNPDGVIMVVKFGKYDAYCPADKCYMDSVGFYVEAEGYQQMPIGPTEEYATVIGNIFDNPELMAGE